MTLNLLYLDILKAIFQNRDARLCRIRDSSSHQDTSLPALPGNSCPERLYELDPVKHKSRHPDSQFPKSAFLQTMTNSRVLRIPGHHEIIHPHESSRSRATNTTYPEIHRCNLSTFSGRTDAVTLNHKAVLLLMSGSQEDEAIKVLKLGLSLMKADLVSNTSSASNQINSAQQEGQSLSSATRRCHRSTRHYPRKIMAVPVHRPRSVDDSFYIYAYAFTFQQSNQEKSLSSMLEVEMLSATIIYNIALALNIKAIRTNCLTLQIRSLRLYEMSMGLLNGLLMPEKNTNKGPHFISNIAVHVANACCNNLANLAFLQGDFERSRTMMNKLQYLLTLASNNGDESSSSSSVFHETDIQGFRWNIMFMCPPTAAEAA